MRARTGGLAAVFAALMLTLAACAPGSPASDASSSDSPTPQPSYLGLVRPLLPPTHPHILRYCPAIDAVHFTGDPGAFDKVYVCTVEDVPPSQNGLPRTKQTVDRIDPDAVAALLTAYSAANAPPTDGACIAMAADPLIVWIVEGDDVVAVRAPVDECGFPTPEATQAFEDAPRETILVAREAKIDE